MKDEKLIDELFVAASHEEPRLSYEQVAGKFRGSLTWSLLEDIQLWLKKISLNQVLMSLGIGGFLLLTALWIQPIQQEKPIQEKQLIPIPPTQEKIEPIDAYVELIQEGKNSRIDQPIAESQLQKPVVILDEKEPEEEDELEMEKVQMPDTFPKDRQEATASAILEPLKLDNDSLFRQLDTSLLPSAEILKAKTGSRRMKAPVEHALIDLILSREDGPYDVTILRKKLESTGLQIKTAPKFSKDNSSLDHIEIRFKHQEGMKFKLSGSGFDKLSFQVKVDATGSIQSFKYRFNEEVYTRDIPLNCKGHKSYLFGPGFSGKTGTTNINIEN